VAAESSPDIAVATVAQQAANCALRFRVHRCGLSAIQRVIHFDRNVIARDIRATIAFQLIPIDESLVSMGYIKHLSCQPGTISPAQVAAGRNKVGFNGRLVAAVILEGCMQAPEVNGTSVNQDRTFKSLRTDRE
jgi:hypothetical protein